MEAECKIVKFGGGCLKNSRSIEKVLDIITAEKEYHPIVVVSALYGVTNSLITIINSRTDSNRVEGIIESIRALHVSQCLNYFQNPGIADIITEIEDTCDILKMKVFELTLVKELTETKRAEILSYGERLSARLIAGLLRINGINAAAYDADKIGIIAKDVRPNAKFSEAECRRSLSRFSKEQQDLGRVPVITGYFAVTPEGQITTFGRNGTDYSAAILARCTNAAILEIWKEVDGFLTADPEVVDNPQLIDSISYEETTELAHYGAKILHPATIEPVIGTKTIVIIRNIYDSEKPGTLVTAEKRIHNEVVKSVTYTNDISLLRLHTFSSNNQEILGLISTAFALEGYEYIALNASRTAITVIVYNNDVDGIINMIKNVCGMGIGTIRIQKEIALIAVVGHGLLTEDGIYARILKALTKAGINVELLSSGVMENSFYSIVEGGQSARAVKAIHKEFFEKTYAIAG
ncbi:MAG: aspartate kinase [Ignavibacteria bacterium]|nr:aspartate kinase [Ignavibacteria bacterium]